jgi:catechol 2,3-dioxygenase-like lactoylglutathione lyase family enzyme
MASRSRAQGWRLAVCVSATALLIAADASAQLLAAKDGPIVYGHHHLNVTSIEAHKKFWIDALGGKPIRIGTSPNEIVEFPNVLIFLRQQMPTGGTKGTTVNHVAFGVQNVRQMVAKLRTAGYPIVTKEEAGAGDVVTDDISFNKEQGSYSAFVMGPDDIKVQLFEVKNQATPIALHHIHFAGPPTDMRDWYVKVFGAKPGTRGAYVTANLPGVDLSFGASPTPVVTTKGHVLDHIGFEVKDLKAFLAKAEGMGIKIDTPLRQLPAMNNLAIAYISDPWGTSIELTEGLDGVQ